MKTCIALVLAAAIVAIPYQANTQEKPPDKVALLLYCAAVVVVVVIGGVIFYCVKNTCDNLFNNPGFSNRLESASVSLPPLRSSTSGYGSTTVQTAPDASGPWSELLSFDVSQKGPAAPGAPGTITVVAYSSGVALATNSSLVYSNGQTVVVDFGSTLPQPSSTPKAGVFRLVN